MINRLLLKKNYKKKIKHKQVNRELDIIIPDTFALEENKNKHEKNDMNLYELRDEISNQKLTNSILLV